MKNWKKDRNYRKFKNADGSFTYIISVDKQDIEVSAAIYEAYSRSARQLEYIEHDLKCDRILRDKNGKAVLDVHGNKVFLPELEAPLEKLMDEGRDFPTDIPQPEDDVLNRMESADLHHCLNLLGPKDREMVYSLFFQRMTVREYADQTGMSKSRVDRNKTKILIKLKGLLAG